MAHANFNFGLARPARTVRFSNAAVNSTHNNRHLPRESMFVESAAIELGHA
jgi:hypothetical protein